MTNPHEPHPLECECPPCVDRRNLRKAVRFFYDVQKLRITNSNRAGKKRDGTEQSSKRPKTELHDHALTWSDATGKQLHQIELDTMREVTRLCKRFPIHKWIVAQKGISFALCGILLSEIDIRKCQTSSALWRYCGLGVDQKTGKRERPTKGVKLHYNKWLKTKMFLLADCCVKANSPWRDHYDNYKHRKKHELVDECMGCEGSGTVIFEKKKVKCTNCKGGTIKQPPWGKSDGHRHAAALRVLGKQFLLELFKQWRTMEGLPVPDPYAVAVLNREHGDHGGAGPNLNVPHPDPRTEFDLSHPR